MTTVYHDSFLINQYWYCTVSTFNSYISNCLCTVLHMSFFINCVCSFTNYHHLYVLPHYLSLYACAFTFHHPVWVPYVLPHYLSQYVSVPSPYIVSYLHKCVHVHSLCITICVCFLIIYHNLCVLYGYVAAVLLNVMILLIAKINPPKNVIMIT